MLLPPRGTFPGKGNGPEKWNSRRSPVGLRQEPAPARPRRQRLSLEARSPAHRPGRCLPRCPRPGGTGHGPDGRRDRRPTVPPADLAPAQGAAPPRAPAGRGDAPEPPAAGTEPSPTARQSTSSATKTFLRSIPQPVRPRGPAPRLTWPGTARARPGGKVRAGGAGRSGSRCPRPGPGRGGAGAAGTGQVWGAAGQGQPRPHSPRAVPSGSAPSPAAPALPSPPVPTPPGRSPRLGSALSGRCAKGKGEKKASKATLGATRAPPASGLCPEEKKKKKRSKRENSAPETCWLHW